MERVDNLENTAGIKRDEVDSRILNLTQTLREGYVNKKEYDQSSKK